MLKERLRGATHSDDKADYILALSNSASPDLVELMRTRYVSDPSAVVRKAAVTALRMLDTQLAETTLIDAISSDPDRHVRLAALRALAREHASERVVGVLSRLALADPSERMRYESVQLMGRLLPKTPSLRTTLEQVAQADTERQIRELAAGTLAGSRTVDDDPRI